MAAKQPNLNHSESYAAELLELFYPIHYRGNMAVEDAMRGELTRKQAAIMWLIRSAGDRRRELRRKEIVRRLQDWFDVSSPAVTKALRHMARAPLGLVRLVEDSDSAREKRVVLTPKGERFLLSMVKRGREFLQRAWSIWRTTRSATALNSSAPVSPRTNGSTHKARTSATIAPRESRGQQKEFRETAPRSHPPARIPRTLPTRNPTRTPGQPPELSGRWWSESSRSKRSAHPAGQ